MQVFPLKPLNVPEWSWTLVLWAACGSCCMPNWSLLKLLPELNWIVRGKRKSGLCRVVEVSHGNTWLHLPKFWLLMCKSSPVYHQEISKNPHSQAPESHKWHLRIQPLRMRCGCCRCGYLPGRYHWCHGCCWCRWRWCPDRSVWRDLWTSAMCRRLARGPRRPWLLVAWGWWGWHGSAKNPKKQKHWNSNRILHSCFFLHQVIGSFKPYQARHQSLSALCVILLQVSMSLSFCV